MRCPNCDRESVDKLGESEATGDTYGCPRCKCLFTVGPEKYDESEPVEEEKQLTQDWEKEAEMLKGGENVNITG